MYEIIVLPLTVTILKAHQRSDLIIEFRKVQYEYLLFKKKWNLNYKSNKTAIRYKY